MESGPFCLGTSRLELVAPTPDMLAAAASFDSNRLGELLTARVTEEWPPELLVDALDYLMNRIGKHPDESVWWMWLFVRVEEGKERVLIGNGGFKGPPGLDGVVECGYAILPEFQRHGYAPEGVARLIEWAFSKRVRRVTAQTFPQLDASVKVMEKLGMKQSGHGVEDGMETVEYAVCRPGCDDD